MMRKFIAVFLLVLLTAGVICQQAQAEPLFGEAVQEFWARGAVADLSAKGILEGFPDGTFRGERAATRWELAVALQRLLARMEAEHATFATKADLEAIRALVNNLRPELEALGVSVTRLEQKTDEIRTRVTDLERIRFYGFVHGNSIAQSVIGDQPAFGSAASPVVDWTTGRLLVSGYATTNLAKLGTAVNATPTTSFGTEFAAFTSVGNDIVASYWGITPPYLSNPFTAVGSPVPGPQHTNRPWTKMSLDRFWYRYTPNNTLLTIGSFQVERADTLVMRGQRNPNINPPEILPFYGINLRGNFSTRPDTPWSYEASYSRLPDASFFPARTAQGSLVFNYERIRARAHYVHAENSQLNDNILLTPGITGAPTLPQYPLAPGVFWRNRFGNTASPFLGSQRMGIAGIDADYIITDNLTFFAKGAVSSYNPDTTGLVYNTTATGNAFVGGLRARFDKFDGTVHYQHVSNKYDPFMLQYPVPVGIPVFLPYSTYYQNYYQIHDYLAYPSNRQGVKLAAGYNFSPATRIDVSGGYLRQVQPSTLENFTTVGNIEPLFPLLTPGASDRGNIADWGVRLRHTITPRLRGGVGYYNYRQRRSAAAAADSIDLREDLAYLNLGYNLSPQVSLHGNFYYIKYRGHLGLLNTSFNQYIPSLTAEANLARDLKVALTYRYLCFKDRLTANQDWRTNQVILDWRYNF
jgi:hypothetical protein